MDPSPAEQQHPSPPNIDIPDWARVLLRRQRHVGNRRQFDEFVALCRSRAVREICVKLWDIGEDIPTNEELSGLNRSLPRALKVTRPPKQQVEFIGFDSDGRVVLEEGWTELCFRPGRDPQQFVATTCHLHEGERSETLRYRHREHADSVSVGERLYDLTPRGRRLSAERLWPLRHGRQRVGMDVNRGREQRPDHQGRLVPVRPELLSALSPRRAIARHG